MGGPEKYLVRARGNRDTSATERRCRSNGDCIFLIRYRRPLIDYHLLPTTANLLRDLLAAPRPSKYYVFIQACFLDIFSFDRVHPE